MDECKPLVRGARSCPPLLVYHPENLEEALTAATRDFCSRNVDVLPSPPTSSAAAGGGGGGEAAAAQVTLPALFEWYREDFGSTVGRCRLTVSKLKLKARLVTALETKM